MPEDEPRPPPEEQDDETEPDDAGAGDDVFPFLDAAAANGPGVTIRAGWAAAEDGEPLELVVNYTGSVGTPAAESAFDAALEWYRDVLGQLAQSEA